MRSYMTDKGFAVKAMRYGEMVAVFVVQTEGVDKILAETGLELSEEERKSAALIYSWYPMTYIRNGEGVPVRLINKMMRAAEKSDVGQRYPLCGRNYRLWSYTGNGNIWAQQDYEERGDFQKENGKMQTLFWKNLKKVESHLMNGDDDCPWFRIEQARSRKDRKFIILCREFMRAFRIRAGSVWIKRRRFFAMWRQQDLQ